MVKATTDTLHFPRMHRVADNWATARVNKNTIEKILSSNADEIEENMIFVLTYNESNNYCAEVAFTNQLLDATTCNTPFGSLHSIKLDLINNIVSVIF